MMVLACGGFLSAGAHVVASPDPADPDDPPVPEIAPVPDRPPEASRRPLVEVPSGCLVSPLPDVVFVGTLTDRDYRTARFSILQVRAGDPTPFAADDLIDVRYGLDVQFLEVGQQYLVSARRDPVLGILASRIRPEPPMFGGDDIVGLFDADVECPGFEDPARTIFPDGTTVETSVLAPLFERRGQILAAVLVPFAVAFGVVFAFASLRLSLSGLARGVGAASARARR